MKTGETDFRAMVTGLVLGAIALLAISFGIVTMVNSHFANKQESGQVSH